MKAKVLNSINALMVMLLAALGFNSCIGEMKYGVQYATLEVSGTVTDSAAQPLEAMRVTVKHHEEKWEQQMLPRTYTNELGVYNEKNEYAFPYRTLDIIVEDPSGVYERDSVRVEVTYDRKGASKDDDWWEGNAHVQQDFQLKKK